MKAERSITKCFHASLGSRFFPDNPKSPIWAEIEAFACLGGHEKISEEIKHEILNAYPERAADLTGVIDRWNKNTLVLSLSPDLVNLACANFFAALYKGEESQANNRILSLLKAFDCLKAKIPFSRN